jgi:formate dehydrogenase subunit gamma
LTVQPVFRIKRRSVLVAVSVILLSCLSWQSGAAATGAREHPVDDVSAISPGAELWREVRQRDAILQGTTQVKGMDSDILINSYGDTWARFRINEVVTYGAAMLLAMLLLIAAFFLVRGRIRIKSGLSGDRVRRFNGFQMVAHWMLAAVFLFLGLTGLVLLFGRSALIPLFGHEAFSVLALASKTGHNYVGLLLVVSLLLMLVGLVKRNLYEKGDLKWMLTAGGMLGKSHPSIGFFNLGEKCLFWLVIGLGMIIAASGIVLLLPIFGQGRVVIELTHIVHVGSALSLLAVSFFHMYLGLYGVEGALDGMTNGYVDINWAEAHHDRWARECRDRGEVIAAEDFVREQRS